MTLLGKYDDYIMTELGKIPVEWEIKELGTLKNNDEKYSFAGGPFGSDLTSKEYLNSGVQIIQLQNIGEGHFNNKHQVFTSEQKADELRKCNIYPGDIVIAKMAEPVARACIVPNDQSRYLMSSDAIRLSPDLNTIDSRFLMYAINSSYFRKQAEINSTGTTRLRIGLTTLSKLKLICPPIDEQQKIAEILGTVDEQIEATSNLIYKTKELKKGIMQQLITNPSNEMHLNIELGESKNSWKLLKLKDITIKITDGSHSSPKEVENVTGYKICTVKNMKSNFLTLDNASNINREDYENLVKNGCKPELNDVLLSKDGTIGKTMIFKQDQHKIVLLSSIAIIRVDNNLILPEYLKYYLENPSTLQKLTGMKSGSAIKRIVLRDINNLSLVLPTIKEQEKIVEILSSVDEQIETYELEKDFYLKLKTGLMQQLLTGKIRVEV